MNKKILIVEDDTMNMKLANDLLHVFGYDTVQSPDGEDVVGLVRLHHPNLVLMDIRLPRRSGLQILRELKCLPDLKRIPIIAVTSMTETGERGGFQEYGFDGYVAKPISIKTFQATIDKYLAGCPPIMTLVN